MQGTHPTRLFNKNLLALAAAAVLAACGGGGAEPQLTAQQAMVKNLEAKAAAIRANAMTKAQAATALMNLAEQAYPNYFPAGAVEGTYGPFMFRYYPSTGNYIGVVVSADASYTMDGIYVVGPAFGNSLSNPSFVGQVSAYVDTSGGGTGGGTGGNGTDNGCFDLASSEVQGHRTQITWQYSGSMTGTVTDDTIVGGMTTFEGRSARETTSTMMGTTTHSGTSTEVNSTTRSYGLRTGTTEFTTYGMVSTATFPVQGTTYTSTYTTIYSPPATDTASGLALGQSQSVTHAGSSSYSQNGGSPSQPYSFSYTTTNTYVARETITVPAGTYETCKFTSQEAGAEAQVTWYIVGRGIPVKQTYGGSSSFTMQATSVKVNGASI